MKIMLKTIFNKNTVFLTFLLVILAACGTTKSPDPVGVGRDVNEYKKSPCACNEIPQNFSDWRHS